MLAQELRKEEAEVRRAIANKNEANNAQGGDSSAITFAPSIVQVVDYNTTEKKRRRWDDDAQVKGAETPVISKSEWDKVDATPLLTGRVTGDETPSGVRGSASSSSAKAPSSRWDVTPAATDGNATGPRTARSRWDETPVSEETTRQAGMWDAGSGTKSVATADGAKKRSRWDETPVASTSSGDASSSIMAATPGATPMGQMALNMATPMTQYGMHGVGVQVPMTPELTQQLRWEAEVDERNRYMTDDELNALFPASGYKILDQPASYIPISTPQRKLLAAPTPMGSTPGFSMAQTPSRESYAIPPTPSESSMPFIKPEDFQYFGKLLDDVDEDDLPNEEMKQRKIMKLLLKIKNGTPPMRKTALRQIADKAREFGAESLFNQILPLLMAPTLEDQERHLLVKVIDRILYKLGDMVRPYVHKILVVIEPLLIDEDYYARVEGREIISNLRSPPRRARCRDRPGPRRRRCSAFGAACRRRPGVARVDVGPVRSRSARRSRTAAAPARW